MFSPSPFDDAAKKYRQTRIDHWNQIAEKRDSWRGLGGWYHRRLHEIYKFLVPPNARVLEIGCGRGDLLASLAPSKGVGADFSPAAIERARARHPELEFHCLDAHDLSALDGKFDVIIFSDILNDLWDVQRVFEQAQKFCEPRTRLILNFYSHLWQAPLALAQRLNLAAPMLRQNWLTREDVDNLLRLANFEPIRASNEILAPLPLGGFANRVLVRLWGLRELALSNFMIARPAPQPAAAPSVSVVVAARNEEGNVKNIFERVPQMGSRTELIFVEGHSKDQTYEAIEKEIARHSRTASLFRQPGIGKADAIRLGFEKAAGDILMILDADLTVPPEDLPRFYEALVSGKGEFINGVRLVYPMEKEAMRFLNFLGNKFFSMAFSWLLGQPIKDTLCGTKVLWRKDYESVAANRAYFGDFDPFGDFDLIFGAAKLNLKIVDLPVRYRERVYGETNISRWKHGLLLFKMAAFAAKRIKFI